MVNKEQIFNGLVRYIDNEINTVLPTYGKWVIGAYVELKFNQYYEHLKAFGATDEAGMTDIAKLAQAFEMSADKYGKISVNIPGLNTMTFSKDDVTRLKEYITGER